MSRPTRAQSVAFLALTMAAAVTLSACSPSSSDTTGTDATSTEAAQTGTVTAQDWSGTEVALEAPAERVVCLDGSCLDAMAELGVVPVAALELDTAQHAAFFGPGADIAALGGSFFEPNIEEIIAFEPDLVIGSASVHSPLVPALGGIPFYGHGFDADQAGENLLRLGALTGREEEASSAVEHWEDVLQAYGPGEREATVLSMYGGATQDVGIDALDSSLGSLLARYTAYPWPSAAEGDSGFLEMSLEEVLTVDPAHIWVLDFGFDPDAPPLVEALADNPAWRQLSAVNNDRVYTADSAWWGTAAGTRAQMLALDTVLPAVYPDEFPEPLSGLALS